MYPARVLARLARSRRRAALDSLTLPFRLTIMPPWITARLGLTTMAEERLIAVLPEVTGRLLDIGCGTNLLVQTHATMGGEGIGVDVFDWGGGALIVKDTSELPFPDSSFDTVTIVAALNHIPNREAVLREARRILRPNGRLVITMISPLLGWIGHRLFWWWGEEKRRGMARGELYGLTPREVAALCGAAGFRLVVHRRFLVRLNHLLVFSPS